MPRRTDKGKAVSRPAVAERRTARGQADRIEVIVNGVRIDVSPELEAAVRRARNGLVDRPPAEMTTNQAAAFLDVSRPFVIKLTKRGDLPCRLVGQHRRIPAAALLDYREKMFQQARTAADEMVRLSQEADAAGPPRRRKAQ
jgi:excisionase family DNA binding protein